MNDPNEDGFVGPTRALFERDTRSIIKTILRPASWLTLTSGFFYSHVNAGQERPFVSQIFGPQPTFISDHTDETAGFLQATLTPIENLILVAGGRFDHFNQFGDVWTYRFAGSYKIARTDTILHASVGDRIQSAEQSGQDFREQFRISSPRRILVGTSASRQQLWENRVAVGATYFHNDLSNVIGFNGLFETLNLGAAETQGLEAELRAQPIADLLFTADLHLSRRGKNSTTATFRNRKARVCRAGRGTKFTFRLRICGGKNCARRWKRNS